MHLAKESFFMPPDEGYMMTMSIFILYAPSSLSLYYPNVPERISAQHIWRMSQQSYTFNAF